MGRGSPGDKPLLRREADNCAIYSSASFTADKNEYLPIPYAQVAASNGHYKQNIGNW